MADEQQATGGYSRRSVLGTMLLGGLAVLSAVPLLKGFLQQDESPEDNGGGFPPEGSIFHPSQDPTTDPRRAA